MKTKTELLCEKAEEEYNYLIKEISHCSKSEIIDKSYEITVKKELLFVFGELDPDTASSLLEKQYPLAYVYSEWLGNDRSFLDELRETACESVDFYLQQNQSVRRK